MSDEPARIAHVRRIEWSDTDAAGVYHWSTVFRLVEAAEAALHERLGIREHTFGRSPRVHFSCDFRRELAFYDAVRTELAVVEVGRTSARYTFSLFREEDGSPAAGEDPTPVAEGERQPAAEGEMVMVHVTGTPGGKPEPWPDEIRGRLLSGGDRGRVEGI